MRQLTNALILLVFVFGCSQGKTKPASDLQSGNLKGNIWKIRKTVHKAGGGAVCPAADGPECNNTIPVYDKKGCQVETAMVDENGDTVMKTRYLYNRSGLCTEKDTYTSSDR